MTDSIYLKVFIASISLYDWIKLKEIDVDYQAAVSVKQKKSYSGVSVPSPSRHQPVSSVKRP